MKLVFSGKTKTVYDAGAGRVVLVFRDDVTGTEAGMDPGGNSVVGQVEGKGKAALRQSAYFFRLLNTHGVPTHFISVDLERQSLTARKAIWNGLEFVVRFRAWGGFVRRYGRYVEKGADLGVLVEITLKDDERGDPLIVDESLAALGIMPLGQVQEAKALVKKAAAIIREDLSAKGLELVDIKFECGQVDGRLAIIDDVSTDNMRVMRDGAIVGPQEILQFIPG